MKIIVLDTETTGMLEKDRICQLSYLVLNEDFEIEEVHNDLCVPPLPISYEAMAIHHITPEMLEGKISCVQTKAYKRLLELNTPHNLLVIQNAAFDLSMLAKEGFTNEMNLIDTFRILRAYYPSEGSFSLQFKRYQWGLYKQEHTLAKKLGITIQAHDALSDVIVLKHLFERLCEEHSIPHMIVVCSEPMVLSHVPYGKHKGKKFLDVCMELKEGLNICVGATGSGKSTTLATIIHEQLLSKPIKTITLEAPIEYYFPTKKYIKNNSIIIQREIPIDSSSFELGLRAAMRQNPDVIFVGEIRDPETAQAALQAANTGHTVMATLHAASAAKAFERLKFLVGNVTNDYSFITSIMFQKLIKEDGKVIPYRETLVC